jgi:hypothetical protein
MSRNKTWKRSSESSSAHLQKGHRCSMLQLLSCVPGPLQKTCISVAGGPVGQTWDPFRPQKQADRPAGYAYKKPNQLVRSAKGSPSIGVSGLSASGSSSQRAAGPPQLNQQAGPAAPSKAPQLPKALPLARKYFRTGQTHPTLRPAPQHAAPPLAVEPRTAQVGASAQPASAAAPAGTSSKAPQGATPAALKRRPKYAKRRPNQLLRMPSLSPAVPGQQGAAVASAHASPAARLRALLARRLSSSLRRAPPAAAAATPVAQHLGSSTPAKRKRPAAAGSRRPNKVYIRDAAGSTAPAVLQKPVGNTGGFRSRLVYVRGSSQAIRKGASPVGALQRARPAGVAGQQGAQATSRARTQAWFLLLPGLGLNRGPWRRLNHPIMGALQVATAVGSSRRSAAGRGKPAPAPRRPAQLRRLGSQMYSVVGAKALQRQATPAKKPGARRLPAATPASQAKRVSHLWSNHSALCAVLGACMHGGRALRWLYIIY